MRARTTGAIAILALAFTVSACVPGAPPLDERATNVAAGNLLSREYGWDQGEQWECLYQLWQKESGWNHLAAPRGYSGPVGIPQALPGYKMATYGDDWAHNPGTQIRWGLDYIAGRYGSPCGAWAHFRSNNWY